MRDKISPYFILLVACWWAALLAFIFANFAQLSAYDLGCPYWPGCPDKQIESTAAQDVLRTAVGTLSTYSIKFMHRWSIVQYSLDGLLAFFLSLLLFAGKHQQERQVDKHWFKFWLCATALYIIFTISQPLTAKWPGSFAGLLQILSGISILALLWWGLLRQQIFWKPLPPHASSGLRFWIIISLVLLVLQIALGAWVTVNRAGLACPDFPTCQLEWWPQANYTAGFDLWHIGREGFAKLDLATTTAIQMAHRVGAVLTVTFIGILAVYVLRRCQPDKLCRYGLMMSACLVVLVVLAVIQVVLHLPSILVVAHGVMAALLLLSILTLWYVATPMHVEDDETY